MPKYRPVQIRSVGILLCLPDSKMYSPKEQLQSGRNLASIQKTADVSLSELNSY